LHLIAGQSLQERHHIRQFIPALDIDREQASQPTAPLGDKVLPQLVFGLAVGINQLSASGIQFIGDLMGTARTDPAPQAGHRMLRLHPPIRNHRANQ
jgi:hypothetical protein